MTITYTITINRSYGCISIEEDSLPKLVTDLVQISKEIRYVDNFITNSQATPDSTNIEKVMESSSSSPLLRPHVRRRLSDKELIGILLFVQDPHACSPQALHRHMIQNGHPSKGYSSRLSEMKRDGLIFKEGSGYRLSYTGRNWIKALCHKFM
jgi:hypothetical protein